MIANFVVNFHYLLNYYYYKLLKFFFFCFLFFVFFGGGAKIIVGSLHPQRKLWGGPVPLVSTGSGPHAVE